MNKVAGPCLVEQLDDLFYLTGMELSKGRLFVSRTEAILFVDGRYYDLAKKAAPCSAMRWEEQNKIFEKQQQITFDSATVSFDAYQALKNGCPNVEWTAEASPVKTLRVMKEPMEIAALKKAAHLTWRGYQKIIEKLQVGVSEWELALAFETFCRKNGASRLSFSPIIAFGENSAYPHHRAGLARLQENQIVLVDVGAVVDHYCGDMTRVFFFGHIDPKLIRFTQIVKKAQKKAIEHVRPGIKVGKLDQMVREEFEKERVKQLYIHSLGHGIGLETHEFPSKIKFDGESSDLILQAGMVITIEPGLYQPGLGGVRIEDMVCVTETGCENFFPHE